jgi:hypothetical protein
VPSNYIERCVVLTILKRTAVETNNHSKPLVLVLDVVILLVMSMRNLEITLICETIRPDRTQIWNCKVALEDLSYPTSVELIMRFRVDCKLATTWDNHDLFWLDVD